MANSADNTNLDELFELIQKFLDHPALKEMLKNMAVKIKEEQSNSLPSLIAETEADGVFRDGAFDLIGDALRKIHGGSSACVIRLPRER